MKLEMEWRVPWPSTWDEAKKLKAAERLVEYMTTGTVYETTRRMLVRNARVMVPAPNHDPYIIYELEN